MTDLAPDLDEALATLLDNANVCRLISIVDLDAALPERALLDDEARTLFAALADRGLYLIESDAADRLRTGQTRAARLKH